jgi:succinate-acetate transporter protein
VSAAGIHPQVRIEVKPYASALPLGFFAFGIGMFLLAAQSAEWMAPTQGKTIGLLLFAFVFPLEFLSAVIAFLARDTLAAAALGVFATSWLSAGLVLFTAKPGETSAAFGYYLVSFGIMVACLAVVALLGKPLIGALLTLAVARSVLDGAYELGASSAWGRASGWIALAIFCVSMYGGLAFLLEDVTGKAVLPVFRIGSSKEAIEGDMSAQLARLETEAGVRQAF